MANPDTSPIFSETGIDSFIVSAMTKIIVFANQGEEG